MKTAMYQGHEVSGEQGVDIRDASSTRPDFRCPECTLPVKVMRAGGSHPAHFEHDERNDHCSLVHRPR
jgi:competence CoiA-like predicted nuclease